jgi:hypothetical protein
LMTETRIVATFPPFARRGVPHNAPASFDRGFNP